MINNSNCQPPTYRKAQQLQITSHQKIINIRVRVHFKSRAQRHTHRHPKSRHDKMLSHLLLHHRRDHHRRRRSIDRIVKMVCTCTIFTLHYNFNYLTIILFL